jgi:hypothetical protein
LGSCAWVAFCCGVVVSSAIDGLLVATALQHNLTIVSRKVADFGKYASADSESLGSLSFVRDVCAILNLSASGACVQRHFGARIRLLLQVEIPLSRSGGDL